MIESYLNNGLEEIFEKGSSKKIASHLHKKVLRILDLLDAAEAPYEMALPGLRFHEWNGQKVSKFSVDLNGPWRITFTWNGKNAANVNLENPH